MKQQIIERFPGISCAWADAAGKEAAEFVKAYHGESPFLQAESAREIAKPLEKFPWTGLGVFTAGEAALVSRGWSENGQCILKMNCRTKEISVVMANRNPGVDQAESGIEWLADRIFTVQ